MLKKKEKCICYCKGMYFNQWIPLLLSVMLLHGIWNTFFFNMRRSKCCLCAPFACLTATLKKVMCLCSLLFLSSSGETTSRPELRSRLFANICHSSDAEMSFSYDDCSSTEKHISSQISPGKEWCEQVNLLSPPLLNTSIRQIQILKSRL